MRGFERAGWSPGAHEIRIGRSPRFPIDRIHTSFLAPARRRRSASARTPGRARFHRRRAPPHPRGRQAARALRNRSASPDFAAAAHFPPPVLRALIAAATAADAAVAADEAAGERPDSAPWGSTTSRWLGESIGAADGGGGVGGGTLGGGTLGGGTLGASPATGRVELLVQLHLCLRNLAGRDVGAAAPTLAEHGACAVAASAALRASDRVGAQAAGLLATLAAHAARLTSPPGRGGRSGAAARALLQARLADAGAAEVADAQLCAHLLAERAVGGQDAAGDDLRPESSSSHAADSRLAAETPPPESAEPSAAAMGAARRCRLMQCLLVSLLARLAAGRPADWEDGRAGAEAPEAFLARPDAGLPAGFGLALLGVAGRAAKRHRGPWVARPWVDHFVASDLYRVGPFGGSMMRLDLSLYI